MVAGRLNASMLWAENVPIFLSNVYYTDITAGSVKKEQKEVIELKIVHAKSLVESVIAEGLVQTAEYMTMVGVDSGNLVVFDRRIGRSWDEKVFREIRQCGDKNIEIWGM